MFWSGVLVENIINHWKHLLQSRVNKKAKNIKHCKRCSTIEYLKIYTHLDAVNTAICYTSAYTSAHSSTKEA